MKRGVLFATSLICSLLSTQAYAASISNVPEVINDKVYEQQRLLKDAGVIDNSVKFSVRDQASQSVKVNVSAIIFGGDGQRFVLELQEIAKPYLNENMVFGDLQLICEKATERLRSKGYLSAVAYLPQQTIEHNGTVTINVILGTYSDINLTNTSKMKTARLQDFVDTIKLGDTVQQRDLDRVLLIIGDMPGVTAHGYLMPGRKEKTVKLRIDTSPQPKVESYVFADNYGAADTGNYRLGATMQINQLSNMGDFMRMSFATTDKDTINYDVRYDVPVGNRGLHMGAAIYQSNYRLGNYWGQFDAYGTSRTIEVFAKLPLKRTMSNSSFIEGIYRYKRLEDKIMAFNYIASKAASEFEVRWSGDHNTSSSVTNYSVGHVVGNMALLSDAAKMADYYGTAGIYQKTKADLLHIKKIGPRTTFNIAMSGQYAWTPLSSADKFNIGGPSGVRAFPQGEASGDHGFLTNIALRFSLKDSRWQFGPFVDYAWIKYNRDHSGIRNAAGVGFSIIFSEAGKNSIRLDIATPISNRYSQSVGKDVKGRVWLQAIFKL